MNVVVTGATSFIGLPMIRELMRRGHHVWAVLRPGSKHKGRLPEESELLSLIELDLGELDRIGELVPEPCEWFCHFGWDGAGSENRTKRDVQQKNAVDSLKALRGAETLGCRRFLFSGSQAEYGSCRDAMTEATDCHPVSEYGKAKTAFGQQAMARVKESGMEYIHARIFSIYGPGDHPWSLVESCLKTFPAGGYLSLGECTQMWNFLYIDDLIRALVCLLEMKGDQVSGYYNVAAPEGETRPLREYVRMMYEACGCHGSYSYGRRPQNAEGPVSLIPDISKMQAATGWQPLVSFREGIGEMTGRLGSSGS